MADPPTDAGEVWGDYVKLELDRQVARKASFEQRALSVITTSGALVTLLFGLASLSTKADQTFSLPGIAQVLLIAALGLFVAAIGAALAINIPLSYDNVTPEALRSAVDDLWTETPSAARRTVAYTRLKVLTSAREVNTFKAWVLFAAIACEFAALAFVAVAVGIVISG